MASSLRDALEAAMNGQEPPADATAPAGAPEVAASPETAPETSPAPEAAPETAPQAAETPAEGGPKRGPDGKFAKTGEPDQSPTIETAQPAVPEPPQGEAIRVPPSLPAAVKAKFSTLDPDVREAFTKLEETVQTAKAEWGRKGERLNRFDEIFAPRREKLQLSGLDEFTAIQTLFAAQDLLERSPVDGLLYLARSYGVDPRQLGAQTSQQGQGFQPQPGQPGQSADPYFQQALQPLIQQVQTLQSQWSQQQEAVRQAELDQGTAQVEAFRSDPANLYFDNVKDDMVVLIESRRAEGLKDAYDKACWANPEIRTLLLSAQQQEQQRQAAAASTEAQRQANAQQQAKAAASARAAGSVTGAPGSTVAPSAGSKGNLRADLLAAMGEHAPGV